MPLYNGGCKRGGGWEEEGLWGSWCASDFHLTLMMFIYFGENGKYTKCKRDRQVCVCCCVYECVCMCVYCIIFLFFLPLLLLLFVSVVFCFALFWQLGDIDSSSLSWVPHHHLPSRILAGLILVSFFVPRVRQVWLIWKRDWLPIDAVGGAVSGFACSRNFLPFLGALLLVAPSALFFANFLARPFAILQFLFVWPCENI